MGLLKFRVEHARLRLKSPIHFSKLEGGGRGGEGLITFRVKPVLWKSGTAKRMHAGRMFLIRSRTICRKLWVPMQNKLAARGAASAPERTGEVLKPIWSET